MKNLITFLCEGVGWGGGGGGAATLANSKGLALSLFLKVRISEIRHGLYFLCSSLDNFEAKSYGKDEGAYELKAQTGGAYLGFLIMMLVHHKYSPQQHVAGSQWVGRSCSSRKTPGNGLQPVGKNNKQTKLTMEPGPKTKEP